MPAPGTFLQLAAQVLDDPGGVPSRARMISATRVRSAGVAGRISNAVVALAERSGRRGSYLAKGELPTVESYSTHGGGRRLIEHVFAHSRHDEPAIGLSRLVLVSTKLAQDEIRRADSRHADRPTT